MTIEEIEQSIASYGEDVFRFCCYLTGNRSSAEDLYQDTFLKAMEITRPVEPDMAGKFLAGVAANLWKNQWRKEKRRQKFVMQNISPENGTPGEEIPGETDLLQDYVKQETGRLLRARKKIKQELEANGYER